ncbi:50S ribosomal protein L11 methyltransferase [Rhodoplanes sp. TEM]|uniref:50S ribosomal protein L11 methyltransferase n=1 Tax=Rhodoplanes tepidamans TaxID=200616 RepID=A0ABT5JJS3_RHOTP|nr:MULTISPECIES: 50S ribosomal protein L11 methyltransferase [Rhodoplanes]MDC7789976.1 50S ribosomal protein L11 methyltransferase [Rhodoplanes tepidamans]MDC7985365.1 50S ribosomal protein L11 methyltransferase [Rhodoplanes sp. TEM]MDQ0359248.1 methylase of polypeptide subunit release factors [Rhodoplanes tepidamans]
MHDVLDDPHRLGHPRPSPGLPRKAFRTFVHFFSYHLFLKRRSRRTVDAAGFRLAVLPTVFDPRRFLTSEYFAGFIGTLDLDGLRVADVGTGSGILALAAARAGAAQVLAVDINPNAVRAAVENAAANGLADRVDGIGSNLLSAVAARPLFDVIISSPPSFPGEPRDVADRAWVAGPDYRDIAGLFVQARERLRSDGRMYVLFSSDSDLHRLGALISEAGFAARLVGDRSIVLETFILYELRPV